MKANKELKFLAEVAISASLRSKAERLKVGCVLADADSNIICYAYNGTVRGMSNICEEKVLHKETNEIITVTLPDVIHAEMNAIAHAARRGISTKDAIAVLTHSPCIHCCAMLIQSGIKSVYYIDKFRTYDEVYAKYKNHIQLFQLELD